MKFVNYFPTTCLRLLFQLLASSLLCHNAVECSLVMDLANNLASSGVNCLVLIRDLDSTRGQWPYILRSTRAMKISTSGGDLVTCWPPNSLSDPI